jgi:O-antigen ligase
LVDTYKLQVSRLAPGTEGLGILEWSRGHDTRASGFYGHYVTFAEMLQLIASLALGILIAMSGRKLLLWVALAFYGGALFLTITRASWLAFAISAATMVLIGASRRTVVICVAIAVPLAVGGLYYLQQKRQVGFFDTSDESTSWRLRTWREGSNLLLRSPRHLAVGIGMDAIKKHYLEWHMFDDGRQPIGHMHNDYLQFALERGIPTLLAWLIWMGLYLKLLWQNVRRPGVDPWVRGVLLGALGGTIGFLVSGFVQYNWGDSEVVMVFYLLMGLSLAIARNEDLSGELA